MAINETNIKNVVSAGQPGIENKIKRQQYYDGVQAILSEDPYRKTGQPRQLTVTNWIKYITDQHTAFSVSNNINYLSTVDENAPLDEFKQYYEDNMLDINDNENFKQAFATGLGVEVLSLENGEVKVNNYNPSEWILLRDPERVLQYAIHIGTYAPGTVIDGEIISKKTVVYTVYDNVNKYIYTKTDNNIRLTSEEPHLFPEVPVVDYQVLADWDAAITDSLIQQQDAYNLLQSGNIDDVLYNVDAMLVLKGYQDGAMTETPTSEDGQEVQKSVLEELAETQTLSLDDDASAEFISKGNVPEKIDFALSTVKKQIHLEGQVVDVEEITGATGSTSGIALKLRFAAMTNAASAFTSYFEKGLRKRIDLINITREILEKPQIENYKIVFTFNIPVNDLETIKEINNLLTVLDKETALSLLSFVDNPKEIIEKKENESEIVQDPIEEEEPEDLVINIQ